ncbi:MAG: ATP-binding cassette domain-containing protein [Opitutales bacterium]
MRGVSFATRSDECLGLVGESGSGKSTLARVLLGLQSPTTGRVVFDGTELTSLGPRAWRPFRRRLQLVFQDPMRALNPHRTIGELLQEPLRLHFPDWSRERKVARMTELLAQVGLAQVSLDRRPGALSGGQRQRLCIARALAVEPEYLVLDEPVSALDVSVQAQILNLLLDLRDALGVGWLFIGHDLAVIEQVCSRVLVMRHGKVVEEGPVDTVFAQPVHPYTQRLLAAARASSAMPT